MHIPIDIEVYCIYCQITKRFWNSLLWYECVSVGREGETECRFTGCICFGVCTGAGLLPTSLPSTHKNTKLHNSLLLHIFHPNNPTEEDVPTLWAPQDQIKAMHCSHFTGRPCLRQWGGQTEWRHVALTSLCSICVQTPPTAWAGSAGKWSRQLLLRSATLWHEQRERQEMRRPYSRYLWLVTLSCCEIILRLQKKTAGSFWKFVWKAVYSSELGKWCG